MANVEENRGERDACASLPEGHGVKLAAALGKAWEEGFVMHGGRATPSGHIGGSESGDLHLDSAGRAAGIDPPWGGFLHRGCQPVVLSGAMKILGT